jgi:hypothetical protein
VLADLDDEECAPKLREEWLPAPASSMCLRIAVREIEAWLMSDRERFATFIGRPRSAIPHDPELVPDPKSVVIGLARRSRKRRIKEDLVPTPGSGRSVGRAYTSNLIDFAQKSWRPDVAAATSDSLARAIACLQRITEATQESWSGVHVVPTGTYELGSSNGFT